jgi:hypothetical protein
MNRKRRARNGAPLSAPGLKGRTFRTCPEPAEGLQPFIFVIPSGLQSVCENSF